MTTANDDGDRPLLALRPLMLLIQSRSAPAAAERFPQTHELAQSITGKAEDNCWFQAAPTNAGAIHIPRPARYIITSTGYGQLSGHHTLLFLLLKKTIAHIWKDESASVPPASSRRLHAAVPASFKQIPPNPWPFGPQRGRTRTNGTPPPTQSPRPSPPVAPVASASPCSGSGASLFNNLRMAFRTPDFRSSSAGSVAAATSRKQTKGKNAQCRKSTRNDVCRRPRSSVRFNVGPDRTFPRCLPATPLRCYATSAAPRLFCKSKASFSNKEPNGRKNANRQPVLA